MDDALRWIAEGRVPDGARSRDASGDELARFARAVLAPYSGHCEWCGRTGCPACEGDPDRQIATAVLQVFHRRSRDLTTDELQAAIDLPREKVRAAMGNLAKEGMIRRVGPVVQRSSATWKLVPVRDRVRHAPSTRVPATFR